MDVWRVLSTALRRWYLIVPLLVLSAIAAVTVDVGEVEYASDGVVLLLPPDAPPIEETAAVPQNPYASTEVATGSLKFTVGSSATRESLAQRGLSPDYDIATDDRSPLFLITVRGDGPEQTIATGEALIELVGQELTRLQTESGVDRQDLITIKVLDEVDSITSSISGRLQGIVALGAVGAALSFLLTILIDDLLIIRRRRQNDTADTDTDTSSEETHALVAYQAAGPPNGSAPNGEAPQPGGRVPTPNQRR